MKSFEIVINGTPVFVVRCGAPRSTSSLYDHHPAHHDDVVRYPRIGWIKPCDTETEGLNVELGCHCQSNVSGFMDNDPERSEARSASNA